MSIGNAAESNVAMGATCADRPPTCEGPSGSRQQSTEPPAGGVIDDVYTRLMTDHLRAMQSTTTDDLNPRRANFGPDGEGAAGDPMMSSSNNRNSPRLVTAADAGLPETWQVHLAAAASGRSTNVFFDIVEFVGRDTIEEEVVAGTGKQIVVKSGLKPKLESVTLSQWSIANLAIMYKLMGEGRLVGQGVVDYLSYTTKIYQLTRRYENASVYFYDREYRKLQAAHNFRWGTDIPHLHTMQLTPRLSRNNRQSQVSQLKQNQRFGPLTADGKAICKMYNTVRGCGYTDCKFVHACSLRGCGQTHPATSHPQSTQSQGSGHMHSK